MRSTILTIFASLALASPHNRATTPLNRPFELIAESRNSAINGQPVTAANGQFYIGNWNAQDGKVNTATVEGTATPATGAAFVASNGGLSLASQQAVYVTPSGVIKFASQAGAKDDEPNSTRSGWVANPDASRGFGKLTFTSGRGGMKSGFMACNVQGSWRLSVILNGIQTGCSEVSLLIPKTRSEYPTGSRVWE